MEWGAVIAIAITVVTIVGYFIAMKYYPELVGISGKRSEKTSTQADPNNKSGPVDPSNS